MSKVASLAMVMLLVAGGSAAQADEHGRWQQIENKANCTVWNAYPQPNEKVTWSGRCANGKAEGHGRMVWRYLKDGEWKESIYTGTMRKGTPHGHGVSLAENGEKYEGDLRDGKQHGHGVVSTANGDKYEGEWKDGNPHGHGVFLAANGDKYEGAWKDGKQHGHGVYVWANGSKYEGDWENGNKEGNGVIVLADGDKCEGVWHKDKMLGKGKAKLHGKLMKCSITFGGKIRYTD